jgi:glycosyltransferase involved in cell wall biosynthesis
MKTMFDKTILVLTILKVDFSLDNGIYNSLYSELAKKANLIIISLTSDENSIVNYSKNVELHNIKVNSTFQKSKIKKALNLLKLNSKLLNYVKKNLLGKKIDLVLYSTPPITLNKSISYIKNTYNAKTYLLLKDIFPQNAVDLKMFSKNSLIYKYFRIKEKNIYKISDYIGCMSQANLDYIVKNNRIDKSKLEINPNSIQIKEIQNTDLNTKKAVLDNYGIPVDKVKFIYGGNLGEPQGIDYIIDVIQHNEITNNFIVIVGSGTQSNRIREYIYNNKILNTVFIEKLPKKQFDILLSACEVGLIFLDNRFTIPNFPSRILSYLEFSKPVIAATDLNTDIGQIIEDNGFGYFCESKNPDKMIELLEKIKYNDRIETMGKIGRKYLEDNYNVICSSNLIINKMEELK